MALALALSGGAATAADVRVRVQDVRSGEGSVLVAICTPQAFLTRACDHRGSARARVGTTEVLIRGVPPGVYAAQAIHDENDNLDLDRNLFGLPLEGLGFSRDAPIRVGPPRFEDAAVEIAPEGGTLHLAIRYY